jgi:hypothetical protein
MRMSFEEFEKLLLENNKIAGVDTDKLGEPVKTTATPTDTDTCKTENVARALVSSSTEKEDNKTILVWVVIGIMAAIMLFFVLKL